MQNGVLPAAHFIRAARFHAEQFLVDGRGWTDRLCSSADELFSERHVGASGARGSDGRQARRNDSGVIEQGVEGAHERIPVF